MLPETYSETAGYSLASAAIDATFAYLVKATAHALIELNTGLQGHQATSHENILLTLAVGSAMNLITTNFETHFAEVSLC